MSMFRTLLMQISDTEVESTFLSRTTADGMTIKDASMAKAVSVKGNSIVKDGEVIGVNSQCLPPARMVEVEQLVSNADFKNGTTEWYGIQGSISIVDGALRFTTNDVVSNYKGVSNIHPTVIPQIEGHTYLWAVDIRASKNITVFLTPQLRSTGEVWASSGVTTEWSTFYTIHKSSGLEPTSDYSIGVRWLGSNIDGWYEIKNPQIFDITPIADLVTTVEDFYRLCPWAMEYQPYGKQDRVIGFGVEERGVNLWDEEWEKGTFNTTTGALYEDRSQIRSKNFINLNCDRQIYFHRGDMATPDAFWIMGFDNGGNIVKLTGGNARSGNCVRISYNGLYTFPSNVSSFKFYCSANYGEVYKNDICINVSDPSINGKYFPYHAPSLLPINTSNFPNGLHGINGVQDEHTPKQDVKRIGRRAYQSGDETDSSVLTDMTYTYYELADPVITPCDDPMAFEAYDQGTESVLGSDAPITLKAKYKKG